MKPHARGAFSDRPHLERLLGELRERQAAPPLSRWELVRRAAEGVFMSLERAGKIIQRDPELTAPLPPGVGGCTNWEAATDALERVVSTLAGLLRCDIRQAARSLRAALVPVVGQSADRWAQQATVRAQLMERALAIIGGEPCTLDTVPGCEALTVEALGIAGIMNPSQPGRSTPEAYLHTLRGSVGGPFDRTNLLHWVAVLWNAARVPLDAPEYPDAQATRREAVLALTYLERAPVVPAGSL